MSISRALISVSDKTGLDEFAAGLHERGVEILSTGGTARFLTELGIPVTEVSDFTGFPELFDGRVKTLHPKIHGGLLHRRDVPEHVEQAGANDILPIDLVAVNLYPFEETVAREDVTRAEAIENIKEAIVAYLESLEKSGDPIPAPLTDHDIVEIDPSALKPKTGAA